MPSGWSRTICIVILELLEAVEQICLAVGVEHNNLRVVQMVVIRLQLAEPLLRLVLQLAGEASQICVQTLAD
jgi:hypothetical protein